MSSSRSCRRSRDSAAGFGRTGVLDFGRAFGAAGFATLAAFFAAGFAARRSAGRAARAALRFVRLAAGFDALRTAFLVGFRAAFRLAAAAFRFAITGILSAPQRPALRSEASLTVYP